MGLGRESRLLPLALLPSLRNDVVIWIPWGRRIAECITRGQTEDEAMCESTAAESGIVDGRLADSLGSRRMRTLRAVIRGREVYPYLVHSVSFDPTLDLSS